MFIPEIINKIIKKDGCNRKTLLTGSTYYLNNYVESGELIPHDYDVILLYKSNTYKYLLDKLFGIDEFIWEYDINDTPENFIKFVLSTCDKNALSITTILHKNVIDHIGISFDLIYKYKDQIEYYIKKSIEKRKKDSYILIMFLYILENKNLLELNNNQLEHVYNEYKLARQKIK